MQSLERAQNRVEVYAIKVTLLGTRPPVWRRILVPREITLRNLHRTVQTVMGWTDSHLHQFVSRDRACLIRDRELGARLQTRTEPSSGN
jgi:Plasmid pRiA4b ORF-3-like protein